MSVRNPIQRWQQGRAGRQGRSWVRPGPTPAQQRIDLLLALWFLGIGAFSAVMINSLAAAFGPLPDWRQQAIWILVLSVPLAWRRKFPTLITLVISAAFITSQLMTFPDNTFASASVFWAIYTLGAWGQNRRLAFWTRVAVVCAMFGLLLYSLITYSNSPQAASTFAQTTGLLDPLLANALYGISFNLGFFLAATFFGTAAWTSARREQKLSDQAAALAAQAGELRSAQEQNARRAVVSERVRIARELHDVVAHHVSVMGVQASAARRVLNKNPDLAAASLTAVEHTARSAISDLRSLLGVLREQQSAEPAVGAESGFLAAPGVDQIPNLMVQAESAGLQADFGSFGEPVPIPAGLSLSAYRIVQEALTNTIKHAAARRVDIRVRYLANSLEVEVTDDGTGKPSSETEARCGFGQIGIRERVAVHGGELELGRRPGGYRVRARFPLPTAPVSGTPETARKEVTT